MRPVFFRVDASVEIGTGHLMRCIALAEEHQARGGRAVFLMSPSSQTFTASLAARAIEAVIGPTTAALATEVEAGSIVVLDGYHFSARDRSLLRELGGRVLIIDDFGAPDLDDVEWVLNQNLGASSAMYPGLARSARLLLGPRYALLRTEFRRTPQVSRGLPTGPLKILLTFGGSDPVGFTAVALQALRLLPSSAYTATVVVGASNPMFAEIDSAARRTALPTTVVRNVADVADLMQQHDLAISAGGTTVWELLYSGLPFAVVCVADNQRAICDALAEHDLAVALGWHDQVTPERVAQAVETLVAVERSEPARRARRQAVVDGRGAERVLDEMQG